MGRETDGEKVGPLPRFPTRMSANARRETKLSRLSRAAFRGFAEHNAIKACNHADPRAREAIHQLVHASQPSAWHVPCRRDVAWADVGLDRCVVPGTGLSREVRHASEDRRELGNQIASDTTRG